MKTLVLILTVVLATACKDENPKPALPDASNPDSAVDASAVCLAPEGTPANCFQHDVCEPTQDVDFLNGCTDEQCVPFDNVARLPRYNNGNLPALN